MDYATMDVGQWTWIEIKTMNIIIINLGGALLCVTDGN